TSRSVELLDDERLKNELRRLERRRGRSGKDSIDHPQKLHDDIANTVAGVIYFALQQCGDAMPETAGNRTFSRDGEWWDEAHYGHPVDVLLDRARSRRYFWN